MYIPKSEMLANALQENDHRAKRIFVVCIPPFSKHKLVDASRTRIKSGFKK